MDTALRIAQIVNALGTVLIGCVVAWIAYQQFRTSRNSFQLSTYDRRRKVFYALQDVLSRIQQEGKPNRDMLNPLLEVMIESSFLFNDKIPDYLTTVRQNILKSCRLRDRLFGDHALPSGDARDQAQEEYEQLEQWFHDQFKHSRELFRKQMKLD